MPGYLTPDSIPGTLQCRVLFIPDAEDWLAVITGAIQTLTEADNWSKWGTLTPEQAAEVWLPLWDDFCFKRGTCRMIGEIVTFAGATNPDPLRWLPADGSSLLRADYPDLFTVIGTTYGAVDGTHFSLPDLQSRVPLGTGSGAGLSTYALGDMGGEETHTLTTAETPAHSHTDTGHSHGTTLAAPNVTTVGPGAPQPTAIPSVGVTGAGSASLTATGGDGAHNNLQPFIALNYFIVVSD